jgi:hypothetical protein
MLLLRRCLLRRLLMLLMVRRVMFCRCRRLQTGACGPALRRCQARGHPLPNTTSQIREALARPTALHRKSRLAPCGAARAAGG